MPDFSHGWGDSLPDDFRTRDVRVVVPGRARDRPDLTPYPRGAPMTMTQALIEELKQESEATRRVLERVPEDQLSWRPHPKSMSLGQLAQHVAETPGGVAELLDRSTAEPPDFSNRPEASSRAELLSAFEESVANATSKLSAWGDEGLEAEWRMVRGEDTLMAQPRVGMVRAIMLNHWYHHRGQLVVYLRLLDVPVPAVYGDSADEPAPFA